MTRNPACPWIVAVLAGLVVGVAVSVCMLLVVFDRALPPIARLPAIPAGVPATCSSTVSALFSASTAEGSRTGNPGPPGGC